MTTPADELRAAAAKLAPSSPAVADHTVAVRLHPDVINALADLLVAVSYSPDDESLNEPDSERHNACDRTVCVPAAALAASRALATATSAAAVVPAADQAALRDRIAAARQRLFGVRWATAEQFGTTLDEYTAAVLEEAADEAERVAESLRAHHEFERSTGALDVMTELRRLAAEAEYAATPCSGPVPCEDGGEPCDTHERLMGHAEGDHELCAPDCAAVQQPKDA
jgi:hypothetical protein